MPNFTNMVLDLVDADGQPITDKVRVELRNTRLRSLDRAFELDFAGAPVMMTGVAAAPEGSAEMLLLPRRYRLKKRFVSVPAGAPVTVREMLFIDPAKATPRFPTITKLPAPVQRLLKDSGFGAAEWNSMDPLDKAGLLNICAKASAVELEGGRPVVSFFKKLRKIKPARIFAVIDKELHGLVLASREFHGVPGGLHDFEGEIERLPKDDSFKTHDSQGNLQITFARDVKEDVWIVDADLDDHQGIRHAFDVIQHTLTGADTHPYNMHQVLVHFQGIQPGYTLA